MLGYKKEEIYNTDILYSLKEYYTKVLGLVDEDSSIKRLYKNIGISSKS